MANKFMTNLRTKISKNRAQTSVDLYMAKLLILNNNKPFNSLSYLTDVDSIKQLIQDKKQNTQISYLTSILVSLDFYPKYKDAFEKYKAMYDGLVKNRLQKELTHEKTEREEKNLIPMDELTSTREDLKKKVEALSDVEELTKSEYNTYLQHLILELYTAIPPRRNQDYLYMYVVENRPDVLEQDRNYLILSEQKFLFNKYKTAKVYGNQEIDIPKELMDVIENYLARSPDIVWDDDRPFLVNSKGKELNKLTGITKVLNKVFNKNIGCSALRHIFISDKFGDTVKEREEIANAMSHSTSTQNKYVRL